MGEVRTEPFVDLICSLLWSELSDVEVEMVGAPIFELGGWGGAVQIEVDGHEVAASPEGGELAGIGEIELEVVLVVREVVSDDQDGFLVSWVAVEGGDGRFDRGGAIDDGGEGDDGGDGVDVGVRELRVVDVEEWSVWKSGRSLVLVRLAHFD